MPLIKSGSDSARTQNALEMIKAGHPRAQAWAAAYRNQSDNKASGGAVSHALEVARKIKKRAAGGVASTPWWTRSEARNIGHSGPIMSALPGRTDTHGIKVASGSYILPADAISHLGQSNSLAGLQKASQMFGHNGPYGMGATMPIHGGSGAPRPPRVGKLAMGGLADEGGARGEGDGLVDVIVAGGEHSIPPEICQSIGRAARVGSIEKARRVPFEPGDLKLGHSVLDKFVMTLRKDHISTLKHLKPPVKK